jgi:hypothetical protein
MRVTLGMFDILCNNDENLKAEYTTNLTSALLVIGSAASLPSESQTGEMIAPIRNTPNAVICHHCEFAEEMPMDFRR